MLDKFMKSQCFKNAMSEYGKIYFPKIYMGRDEDDYIAALRAYRSMLVYKKDGRVVSSEMIYKKCSEWDNPDIRNEIFSNFKSDNKTTIFNGLKEPEKVKKEFYIMDFYGDNFVKTINDQLYLLEIFLNLQEGSNEFLHPVDEEFYARNTKISLPPIRPLNVDIRNEFKTVFTKILKEKYMSETENFRNILSKPVMESMSNNGINGCLYYNWLSGYDPINKAVDNTLMKRRLQACQSYPLFSRIFSEYSFYLSGIIDEAKPLTVEISKSLNIEPEIIKRMGLLTYDIFDLSFAPKKEEILKIADIFRNLPKQIKIKSKEDFIKLSHFTKIIEFLKRDNQEIANSFAEISYSKINEISAEDLRITAMTLPEFINDMSHNVFGPMAFFTKNNEFKSNKNIIKNFISQRNIVQIVEVIKLWTEKHNEIHLNLAGKYPKTNDSNSWLSLHKPFKYQHNGKLYEFKALTNDDELKEEGDFMKHCVGSYTPHCLHGRSHIISMRELVDEKSTVFTRIATIEIMQSELFKMLDNPPEFSDHYVSDLPPFVNQFFGFQNSRPENIYNRILWGYAENLVNDIKVDVNKIKAEQQERNFDYNNYYQHEYSPACYDYKKNGSLNDAWRYYGVFFPKTMRNLNEFISKNTKEDVIQVKL